MNYYILIDYNIIGSRFPIGSISGFFWNGALGAGIGIADDYFGVSIIVPFEFGFNFPVVLSGIDLYLQATPLVNILPSFDPGFDFGLGARIRL